MTSRRAVAPVIATLLLVAIAVVGGSIIFVFSQGFFSSAQISGAPQIESVEITGYDASDVFTLQIHDGLCTNNCAFATAWDGASNNGMITGERVAVYVQNQSAQKVTLNEVNFAGTTYTYEFAGVNEIHSASTPGEFQIISSGVSGAVAFLKTDPVASLEAGEEATILFALDSGIANGRDAQFKIKTAAGAIFVGTVLVGQQSG
jgi:flagellin-like protein